jgi:alpha-glucosidase
MVERMEASAAMAAKYGLIVDFHGCSKPSGFNRTYPNVLTFEGVRGMEYKIIGYGKYDMLTYNLQFPFIRSVAGPADLTPGAMVNRPLDAPVVKEEASIGTRCHQHALFLITYSPFHCACDSPARYNASETNSRSLRLIGQIPTVWDETLALSAEVDSHIIVARRSGEEWYLGGICGREPYRTDLCLDFLKGSGWEIEICRDASDADRNPENYVMEKHALSGNKKLDISMAPAGGFTARIYRKK